MNIESEIPLTGLYADEAPSGLIEPPTSAQFHAGVEPEMTLPAAWWNYFANLFTNTNIKAKLDILAILAELNNALVAAGITPDPGLNNQLVTLLQKGHGSTVNADKLDGLEAGNASGQIPINNGTLNTNLIAASAAVCSGNAASATKLQTARTIGGVSFNGTANINLPGVNTQGNQNTTGTAANATKLQTARTIGGVAFDGSANINLPGVNTAGNQNTSGKAATATKLATARTIGGVSFDGTANINLPGVNTAGNQNTSGNAATAGGVDFVNGEAGTYATKNFSADETWVIPKGLYMFTVNASTGAGATQSISLQINNAGTWSGTIIPVGLILSDGINYRLKNHATSVQGAIYRKLA